MSRSNPAILFGFFVAIIVAMSGAALLKGGLFVGRYEGDTFHLLQIVFRMADGQLPHLDFMTPIGVLAFAPIVLFMKLGFGVGTAMLMAQTLVAAVFLPGVWWAAYSRMRGMLPYAFGLIVLVLITALVHGKSHSGISMSMHYNRWAWAAAFVAIAIAILPNEGKSRPVADGLVVGLALSAMLMLKATYFAAFIIPVLFAMVMRGNYRAVFVALFTGLLVAVLVSLIAGFGFWQAYLADLLAVASSEIRPNPGDAFGTVVGAPAYVAGSLALILGVVFLRQSGEHVAGLILLLLVPGFFYVTYQNFGNDPQWLLLLGVLLIALRPVEEIRNGLGWDMRAAVQTTAVVAFALTAPSFFNLAYSPFRHLNADIADYAPLLPRAGKDADMQGLIFRTRRVNALVPLDGPDSPYAAFLELENQHEVTVFRGETLPNCELESGMSAWFQATVDELEDAGLADGKRLFAADVLSSHWLFGTLLPLQGGAPWYYGGLAGFDRADYLLVPLCPVLQHVRVMILDEIQASGANLTEIRRTSQYILYAKGG